MNGKETIQDISIGDVSDVSIICATIERPDSVTRFINSVRKFYQDISIIIGDQSRDQTELAPFTKEMMSNVFGCLLIVELPMLAMSV